MANVIRWARDDEKSLLHAIWYGSAKATHTFVPAEKFEEISDLVKGKYLPNAKLEVFVGANDQPLAFMGMTGNKIDSLFVAKECFGKGIGRAMMEHAQSKYDETLVDVNEDNPGAIGFYKALGYKEIGRSETDEDGLPYPIIHLKR